MTERRQHPSPSDAVGYLRQLPSLNLLDRLPIGMLGVGRDGDIAYANPTFAAMLGHPDVDTTLELDVPSLLHGHEDRTPADCADILRTATSVVEWNHDQGYVLRTMLFAPLLMRATDALLLVAVTDVTAWHWDTENHHHRT